MRKLRTSILALSFLLLGGVVISAGCQEKERRPSRYLIPDGYVGWVRINFNVKDALPVSFEDGHYLFKFPARRACLRPHPILSMEYRVVTTTFIILQRPRDKSCRGPVGVVAE